MDCSQRGNVAGVDRSIPAYAGRTTDHALAVAFGIDPSPRPREELVDLLAQDHGARSIPACAGRAFVVDLGAAELAGSIPASARWSRLKYSTLWRWSIYPRGARMEFLGEFLLCLVPWSIAAHGRTRPAT